MVIVSVLPSTRGDGSLPTVFAPVQQGVEESPAPSAVQEQGGSGNAPGAPSEPLEAPGGDDVVLPVLLLLPRCLTLRTTAVTLVLPCLLF